MKHKKLTKKDNEMIYEIIICIITFIVGFVVAKNLEKMDAALFMFNIVIIGIIIALVFHVKH